MFPPEGLKLKKYSLCCSVLLPCRTSPSHTYVSLFTRKYKEFITAQAYVISRGSNLCIGLTQIPQRKQSSALAVHHFEQNIRTPRVAFLRRGETKNQHNPKLVYSRSHSAFVFSNFACGHKSLSTRVLIVRPVHGCAAPARLFEPVRAAGRRANVGPEQCLYC